MRPTTAPMRRLIRSLGEAGWSGGVAGSRTATLPALPTAVDARSDARDDWSETSWFWSLAMRATCAGVGSEIAWSASSRFWVSLMSA